MNLSTTGLASPNPQLRRPGETPYEAQMYAASGAGTPTQPHSQPHSVQGAVPSRAHSAGSSGSGRTTPAALANGTTLTVPPSTPGPMMTMPHQVPMVSSILNSQTLQYGHHPNMMSMPFMGRTPPPNFAAGITVRRYNCKLCPMMFDSKAELQLHTQVHMREAKPYKCTQCPKSFANSSYLSQHMRIHLGIKPFGPCQYCGRKFTQLSHLQQHLRTHTGEKPYKCRYPNCEKAFSQLSNLQSHSRCHQSDKPFKCNSCYKCFSDESSLLEHIPKHNETKHVKKCICPYCGKSYSQPSYLAKHMTKHADKKPGGLRAVGLDESWATSLCSIHGVPDSCGESAVASLPYSFSAHNHMMQPPSCAYGTTAISASTPVYAGHDPSSAFRRLGLGVGLSTMAAASSSRNPYFYDTFKPNGPHANMGHGVPGFPSNLIRLDDIRQYTDTLGGSIANTMFTGAKREAREAAY